MLYEVCVLLSPVAALGLGMVLVSWDTRHWKARIRAAARPVPVRVRPPLPPLPPVLDVRAGRAARRARHGGAE